MMFDKTYSVQELIDLKIIQIGDGYRAKNSELTAEGFPFARAGNLNNGFNFNGADRFPIKNREKVEPKISQPWDCVFTSKGTVGRIALVKEDTEQFIYSPQLCYWRSLNDDIIDPVFLYYWMYGNEFRYQINYLKGQTDMADYVSLRDQKNMKMTIPNRNKQQKIKRHIFALDNKIELNRQTNQTLEQIAQAIFKSWFVDFDPVKAKIQAKQTLTPTLSQREREQIVERAAMCAISGKSLEELEQLSPETQQQLKTTAALFPDALVESELGEIPEGWGVQIIEDVIELVYGKALKKTNRVDGEYPVYGSGGLTGTHNQYLVDGPGIIVGRKGTVGSLYWEDNSFYPIDTVFYVKCKDNMTLPFSFYLLQTLGLKEMNTDAAVPGLNRNNVYRLDLPKYPNKLLEEYSNTIYKIRNKVRLINEEINTLETIRNALLPKLLSGELSIGSTEPSTEAVA